MTDIKIKTNKAKAGAAAKPKVAGSAKNAVEQKVAAKKVAAVKKTPKISVTKVKNILIAASEAMPFIASGGLAEVVGSLPKALQKTGGCDVRVVLPLYSGMNEKERAKLKFLFSFNVPLSWRSQYCGVFMAEKEGVKFYFIDNEYYFSRPELYGYYDDGERFAFLSKSVLELLPMIDFYPDIIHANDWQTALVPVYLKTTFSHIAEYSQIKTLFTIHNIEYQGKFSHEIIEDIFGISRAEIGLLEFEGCINLMKAAIFASDRFNTVSPNYANEIKSSYFASGLEDIINANAHKLSGILNGIDTDFYNSKTDDTLFSNFDINDLSGKKVCKSELQKMLNLPVREDIPIIAMITRLASHKGLDLVKEVIHEILSENVQFILLGTGDKGLEDFFVELSHIYEGKIAPVIAFNNDLSRKIYSGADLFLMPSKTEPCGLSQMIALRYATIPIVRETGGLFDSIKPYGAGGNGFTFADYNAYDMLYVIKEAIELYKNKDEFTKLMKTAMESDFSWKKSADTYLKLYDNLTK